MYSQATISHFVWRYTNLPLEDNTTPLYMYDMVEHYLNSSGYVKNIMAFRGSGKSINTCILALGRVATGLNRFVMIVSDTMTQAEALISDILTLIEDGRNSIVVTRAVTGKIEFLVDGRAACIMGVGAGMSLRGRKFKRLRADLVITDDLMNDAVALNKLRMDRLSRWMYKVLMPSMNPASELWNVGTPLNVADIFMSMVETHGALEIPLTNTSWPDRFTPEWIVSKKAEYKAAGMLSAWKQEMELVLVDAENAVFNMGNVLTVELADIEIEKYEWVIALDGGFGGKGSDRSAICCMGISSTGKHVVYMASYRDLPQVVIGHLFRLQALFGAHRVGIEKGAFKNSMEYEIGKQMEKTGQYFRIEPLHTSGSKISRILALEPLVNGAGITCIDWDTEEDSALERLIEQMEMTSRDGCAARNDDEIDGFCQVLQLLPYVKNDIITPKEVVAPRVLPMIEG